MFQHFSHWDFFAGMIALAGIKILFTWAKEKILPYQESIWDLAKTGEKITFKHGSQNVTGTIVGIKHSRNRDKWEVKYGRAIYQVDPKKDEWEKA